MRRKLTNEIIDGRLLLGKRPLRRVGEVSRSFIKIEWECSVCNYHWMGNPSVIARPNGSGSGCPNCGGNIKITNDDVDNRLLLGHRPIKRIGDVVGSNKIPILWGCIICTHEWMAATNYVTRPDGSGSGCPKCAGVYPLDITEINHRLSGRPIRCIGSIKGDAIHTIWKCTICSYEWSATPNSVAKPNGSGSGCPSCSDNIPLTDDIIDRRISDNHRPIRRIGCVRGDHPIEWLCGRCHHHWWAKPAVVTKSNGHGTGCPRCCIYKNTNEVIDGRLVGRNITRLTDSKLGQIALNWSCDICGNIWDAQISSVTKPDGSGSGCVKCSGKLPLSNEMVDERLLGRDITRIDNVNGIKNPINWSCDICSGEWIATPSSVAKPNGSGSGCPRCKDGSTGDRLYIIQTRDIDDPEDMGRRLIKIGISSSRLYRDRIVTIGYSSKMKWFAHFNESAQNARSLETYAHEYYSAKVEFDHKWSGHSECRWLFEYELEMLLKYITDNIIPLGEIITDPDPS